MQGIKKLRIDRENQIGKALKVLRNYEPKEIYSLNFDIFSSLTQLPLNIIQAAFEEYKKTVKIEEVDSSSEDDSDAEEEDEGDRSEGDRSEEDSN